MDMDTSHSTGKQCNSSVQLWLIIQVLWSVHVSTTTQETSGMIGKITHTDIVELQHMFKVLDSNIFTVTGVSVSQVLRTLWRSDVQEQVIFFYSLHP